MTRSFGRFKLSEGGGKREEVGASRKRVRRDAGNTLRGGARRWCGGWGDNAHGSVADEAMIVIVVVVSSSGFWFLLDQGEKGGGGGEV